MAKYEDGTGKKNGDVAWIMKELRRPSEVIVSVVNKY